MLQTQIIGLTRKRASALDRFKSLLRNRKINRGQKLPSERDLCSQMEISRGLLRTLLDDLESVGVVRRVSAHRRILIDPSCSGSVATLPAHPMANDVSALEGVIAMLGERGIRKGFDLENENADTAAADWDVEQYANLHAIESGYHALGVQWQRLNTDGGRWLLSQRPAGLVALRNVAPEVLRQAVKIGIPTVAFSELNLALGVPCVASDHCGGMKALTQHAIDRGAKKILRLWAVSGSLDNKRPWLGQRDRGYKQACAENQIQPLPAIRVPHNLINEPADQQLHRNARTIAGYMLEHLRDHGQMDVILATNDAAAFEVAHACQLLDIKPGEDVLIYGYDNFYDAHPYCQHSNFKPVMTVDKCNSLIGRTLIDVLLGQETDTRHVRCEDKTNHLVKPLLIDPTQSATHQSK
jgi:DNA-binding LacI/PurR family transcriptional regulator